MSKTPAVWGIHMGEHVGMRPIDEGHVAIGWPNLGDPRQWKAAPLRRVPSMG